MSFTYGTNPASNNVGRLVTMTDGVGSETYSYDPNLPLTTQVQKVINGTTYTTGYGYNLAGELTSVTYPSGRVVTQSYDAIGRLSTIASGGTNYASSFAYNTAFQVTGFTYGNGVTASFGYSPDRLQLTSLGYVKSSQTLYGANYWYKEDSTNCPGAAAGNDGQIQCITDSVDTGRNATYTYDALARLTAATTVGSTNYPQWGLAWTYDRYDNRSAQSVTAGSAPSNSVEVSATTNRITTAGYAYDANGNMTNDGQNTLVYDGENRLTSSSGGLGLGTYTYDGGGLRVKKVSGSTTTVYVFSGSKVIAEYVNGAAPASPTCEYIYSGSSLLAKVEGGATQYYHQDHLSVRTMTNSSGSKIGEQGHFPYGEQWYAASTTTKWQYTTYERDAESGNDYAMAREYVNRLGRFSALDPMAGSTADPQTLNKYPYAGSDPVNNVDPTGECFAIDGSCVDNIYFSNMLPYGFGWNSLSFFGLNIPFRATWWDCPGGDCGWYHQRVGTASGAIPPPDIPYDPRIDFRNYAVELSNNKNMSDCEKAARLINKAGQVWSNAGDIVEGLEAGLTERSGRRGTSDPNYRVGVFKSDPNYAQGFGDSGFSSQFRDSSNQIRHFVGWFAAGYLSYGITSEARRRLYGQEHTKDKNVPDVALGLAAIAMGNAFAGDAKRLAQDFWHSICGGTKDLEF